MQIACIPEPFCAIRQNFTIHKQWQLVISETG